MDASVKPEFVDSPEIQVKPVAGSTPRGDFYFRPDPWVDGLVHNIETLLDELVESDNELIESIGRHMLFGMAKRLRPIFVLLSQHLFNGETLRPTIECAASAELIHCASLFHDDVIDNARTRKGKAAANSIWGNKSAVIMGDHFFVLAYDLLARQKDFHLIELYVDMCRALAEGVMNELNNAHNLDLSEDEYFEIIRNKTARFFSTCAVVGGYLSGPGKEYSETLAEFGLDFGIAFQLSDDLLDLFADPVATGKPRGSDIRSGVYTVPVIRSLRDDPEFKRRFIPVLEGNEISGAQIEEIAKAARLNGSLEYTQELVNRYGDRAMKSLGKLPDGKANDTLRMLLERIVNRTF